MLCGPTVAGFYNWCLSPAGLGAPSADLPPDSPYVESAFCNALQWVNRAIQCASPLLYAEAIYNLAGQLLLEYCPDQPDQTFFTDARGDDGFNLTAFVPGVVSQAADVSTGDSLLNPDFMKGLSMMDLQMLKTPYGRKYLMIAQAYGPDVWGLS